MSLANLVVILAGVLTCLRQEIRLGRTSGPVRGRPAQSIGIALIVGGVLAQLLPRWLLGEEDELLTGWWFSLTILAVTFWYVWRVVVADRRQVATLPSEPPPLPPQPTPAATDAVDGDAETLRALRLVLPPAEAAQPSPFPVLSLLLQSQNPAARAFAQRLHTRILKAAVAAAHERRTTPLYPWVADPLLTHLPAALPSGWRNDEPTIRALREAAAGERHRAKLESEGPVAREQRENVERAAERQRAALAQHPGRWELLQPGRLWAGIDLPSGVDPLVTGADRGAEQTRRLAELAQRAAADPGVPVSDALRELLCWPDAEAATFLRQACVNPVSQAYAMQALALSHGAQYWDWWEWEAWLKRVETAYRQSQDSVAQLTREFGDELRRLWLREQGLAPTPAPAASAAADVSVSVPPAAVMPLQTATPPIATVASEPLTVRPAEIPPPVSVAAAMPAAAAATPPPPVAAPTPLAPKPAPEPVATGPTVWDEHIRPFLATNWYIIAGLLMVVMGASVLAYFTWDKSALVRYLFLPLLLAAFTGGMAELGLRLGRRHEDMLASGTFLVGAAVCLLPVNFMVLCRAADDPAASGLLLPGLVLYTALAGLGLWRWCGGVHPRLRGLLGLPLLAINLIAVAGDMPGLREAVMGHRALLVPMTLTAAVLLGLAVSNRFLQRVLTKEMLEGRIVPWFFGFTLAATTVQVSLWRHFHLQLAPQPRDYALAAILVGATLLRWERRAGELRDTGAAYGGESFLGYAALVLGVLMAAGHEWLRIAALLGVGVIWLVQASRRPGVVHYWIGLTFCLLGGAAFGLLEGFPKHRELNLLPELGLALALIAGAVRALAGRAGVTRLREVAREIQPPILLLTSIIAVLSQYRVHSAPWQTGGLLLVAAGFFAVRATAERRRDWLNIAAINAALALPYLGCADMLRYRFDSNALALGFGLLAAAWLAVASLVRREPWGRTSALIATVYGGAGIAGLVLRLLLADPALLTVVDLAGGVTVAVVLGVVAWRSGAQTPAVLGVATLTVLLPLFGVPAETFPWWLHVGTGMTSAVLGTVLMLGCFVLRRSARNAGDPSPDFQDTTADRTRLAVFLAPLLGAVAWLSVKALLLQLQHHEVQLPFALSALAVAATAYTAALYERSRPLAKVLWHASWVLLAAGIAMLCDHVGCRGREMLQYPALWTGVVLTVWLAVEVGYARRHAWAADFLVGPRLRLLAYASVAVAVAAIVSAHLPPAGGRTQLQWLALFVGAQLGWHGLRTGRHLYGGMLFVLGAAWMWTWRDWPGFAYLPAYALGIAVTEVALEFVPAARAHVRALRMPFVAGMTLLATALAFVAAVSVQALGGGIFALVQPRAELVMIVLTLLLAARTQGWAALALLASVLGYLLLVLPCSTVELYRPWRVATLALFFGALPFVGRALVQRWGGLLRGPEPQVPETATQAQALWFLAPGVLLAVFAALVQIRWFAVGEAPENRWVQIYAPFAAVVTVAMAAFYLRHAALWVLAACALPVANLFFLWVFWGRTLLDAGLSSVHLVGLAAVATMAEFIALRSTLLARGGSRFVAAAHGLHQGCVILAGSTIVALAVNYLAHPDLARIPLVRFAVSGLLAIAAGLYFRRAARRPENLRTSEGVWLEALWHVALGFALWCAALLLPALRTPDAALYALALPSVVLWLTAESLLRVRQRNEDDALTGGRFRRSAALFALLVLGVYVFRLPSQMLLFPSAPLDLHLYHTGAAAAVLVGLILLRLRGLGNAPWHALVGGLAVMTGVYFALTWIPGWSTFTHPTAGAWAALGAGHLLILLSYQRSPVRSWLQSWARMGDEEWYLHRQPWGWYLTSVVHLVVLSALLQDYRLHSVAMTPLLAALATVLVHQALLGTPLARAYWAVAAFELLLALHLDFVLPSDVVALIPAKHVFWFLLLPWLAAALGWRRLESRLDATQFWPAALAVAVLSAGHLWYHGPASGGGLTIAVLLLASALLTRVPAAGGAGAREITWLLLLAPTWLAYFGTRWLTADGAAGFRPWLAAVATLVAGGVVTRLVSGTRVAFSATAQGDGFDASPTLGRELLRLGGRQTELIARVFLVAAFAGLALLTFAHPTAAQGSLGQMLALALVWAVLGVVWFREGHWRDGLLPYVLSLLSVAGAWVVLRRLLMLHFDFWTYEYDIWLSLGASIAFSAGKRLLKHEHPGLGRTITGAVWLMPVLQCGWLLFTRMDADLTLLVIGVQAMLFAWQGGGRRDSPYNAVSMLGFVGFVCLLFWAKLDLRAVQAYTIPVGLGVLGLVWLFGRHMTPALRHAVRLVTILVMLGSCGYYALLDGRYPLAFHATMIGLCLAIMALGPLLRVQLYLYLGFAGLVMDLAALVAQQFRALDRSIQMMGIGASLLGLGVAVVGGAIYFKAHRAAILARMAALRARLGSWE